MIVSNHLFMWFITGAALFICVFWGAWDVRLLVRNLSRAGRDSWTDQAAWRDQIFGSIIGLTIIALGLYGILRFWQHY